jgi:RpiR family transcriptional regulator, carbohydrate utilization regulator
VYRDVRSDEPAAGVAAKVLDRTIGALIAVRNSLSSDSVASAIAILADARRIEFYGAGGSGIAALDMQHKFFKLGVPSVAYADPHTYTTSAALLGPGDVVVAISNTGRTKDILDACKSALDGGAKVIAITHGNSPLARMASVGLFANVDEDTDIFSPMTSRVSHLAIGDILAVGLALARGPGLAEKLAEAKDVLERRRVATGD